MKQVNGVDDYPRTSHGLHPGSSQDCWTKSSISSSMFNSLLYCFAVWSSM